VTDNDLFISDLHLDRTTARRRAALVRFLERHGRGARRLFILGDLFNAWIGRKQLDEPDVVAVTEALRRAAEAGTELHFVAGNRDFYALEALGRQASMTTHAHGFAVESFGQRVWVCHGHELYRHDNRTRQAQSITHARPVEWVFGRLPKPLAMFLANGYTSHSKRVVRHKSRRMLTIPDESLSDRFAAGCDAIVCGHTHRLGHTVCRREGVVVGHLYNLGAWDDRPHFLRHGPDGWHFHTLDG